MKFFKNPCNLYFTLWCIYLLQGTLYESGSIISQTLLMLILLISLKDAYNVNKLEKLPAYFKGLNALVFLFTIYWLVLIMTDGFTYINKVGNETSSFNYLRTLYYSLLPIYSCYLYTRNGNLNANNYKKWVAAFVLVAIAEYVRMQREMIETYMNAGSDQSEFTNNIGYMIMLLTPCAFIYNKNTKIQILVYGICLLFVVLSMKRGAMLISFVALLIFLNDKFKMISKQKKTIFFTIIAIIFILLYGLIEEMLTTSVYFQERLEETMEGNSSGRDEIYSELLHHFVYETNVFQMFLGIGAEGTLKINKYMAHNDWLEILTNQGIVGIFLYIYYWLTFRYTCLNKKYSMEARFALKYLMVILFLRTMFSMSIMDMNIYSSSMLGYALADGFKRDFE